MDKLPTTVELCHTSQSTWCDSSLPDYSYTGICCNKQFFWNLFEVKLYKIHVYLLL